MKAILQRMKNAKAGLVIAIAMIGLSACANINRETGNYSTETWDDVTVAVLPFENFTNHHNAGMVAAEITVSELRGRDAFKHITPLQDVRLAFEKEGVKEGDRIRNTKAADIGKALGVDAVLIGSVSEYGYQYGLREEPSVTYNMRLVDTTEGKVLWTFSAGQVGRGVFSRASVSLVAFSVVENMVDALLGNTHFYNDEDTEQNQP